MGKIDLSPSQIQNPFSLSFKALPVPRDQFFCISQSNKLGSPEKVKMWWILILWFSPLEVLCRPQCMLMPVHSRMKVPRWLCSLLFPHSSCTTTPKLGRKSSITGEPRGVLTLSTSWMCMRISIMGRDACSLSWNGMDQQQPLTRHCIWRGRGSGRMCWLRWQLGDFSAVGFWFVLEIFCSVWFVQEMCSCSSCPVWWKNEEP